MSINNQTGAGPINRYDYSLSSEPIYTPNVDLGSLALKNVQLAQKRVSAPQKQNVNMKSIVGGVVDAGVQLGGMLLQNKMQKDAEKRANDEWTRRFQLENEYNSPSAQAERLKDAGVNPLAQLTGSSPTPSSSGSTNTPSSPSQSISPQFAEILLQSQQLANETKLVDAQVRKLDAETASVRGEESRKIDLFPLVKTAQKLSNEGKISENVIKAVEAMYSDDHWYYTIEQQTVAISRVIWQNYESGANIMAINQEILESSSRIALNQSQGYLNETLASKNMSDIQVNNAEISKICREIAHMDVTECQRWFELNYNAQVADAQVGEIISRAKVFEAESVKIQKETKYVGWRQITSGISDLGNAAANFIRALKPYPEIQNKVVVPASVGSSPLTSVGGLIFDQFGNVRK